MPSEFRHKNKNRKTNWPAAGRKACSSCPLSLKLVAEAGALLPCKPSKLLPLQKENARAVLRRVSGQRAAGASSCRSTQATQFPTLLSFFFPVQRQMALARSFIKPAIPGSLTIVADLRGENSWTRVQSSDKLLDEVSCHLDLDGTPGHPILSERLSVS